MNENFITKLLSISSYTLIINYCQGLPPLKHSHGSALCNILVHAQGHLLLFGSSSCLFMFEKLELFLSVNSHYDHSIYGFSCSMILTPKYMCRLRYLVMFQILP